MLATSPKLHKKTESPNESKEKLQDTAPQVKTVQYSSNSDEEPVSDSSETNKYESAASSEQVTDIPDDVEANDEEGSNSDISELTVDSLPSEITLSELTLDSAGGSENKVDCQSISSPCGDVPNKICTNLERYGEVSVDLEDEDMRNGTVASEKDVSFETIALHEEESSRNREKPLYLSSSLNTSLEQYEELSSNEIAEAKSVLQLKQTPINPDKPVTPEPHCASPIKQILLTLQKDAAKYRNIQVKFQI